MKKNLTFIFALAILLLANGSYAQTLFWDGGTASIATNGVGVSQGAAGTWDNVTSNWDQGAGVPFTAWVSGANASFGLSGIAVGAGTVTLAAPITANSITVTTTNYIFTDGGNTVNTLTVNNITNSAVTTISNNLVNSTGFTKAGSSTLTLLAASSGLTGPVNVDAGSLYFGNASTLTGPTSFGDVTVAANATFKVQEASATTYSQNISGAGAFYADANTVSTVITLTGSSTFTGPVTINQATLAVISINDTNPCALGNGTNVIIAAGGSASTLLYEGYGDTTARALTIGGTTPNAALNNNGFGPLVWDGPLLFATTNQHTLSLGGTASYANIFGGTIPDNATTNTIVKQTGTWMLAGTNTYSGGTLLGGGTLIISNDYALGAAAGPVAFTGSYALKSASNNVTLGASRTVTVSNAFTANFGVTDTNNFYVASLITGPGGVTKASASYTLGTVRFSNNANNYTGDFTAGYGNTEFTSVSGQGTASSLGVGASGTGGKITIANSTSSGALTYVGTGNSATTRPLSWTATTGGYQLDCTNTGTIAYLSPAALVNGAGAKTLTLAGSNTGTNTLAQVINDDGGSTTLVKSGAGEWILTAVNDYSGSTTVSDGTLLVNGMISNSIVTVSGGILGGAGTIGGPVTVTAGGTLAAGNPGSLSVATLTITNSVTNSGTIFMKLNPLAGTNDVITGMGTLVYGGTLSLTNLAGNLAVNDSFNLFSAANYQGAFSSIVPATPGNGLAWNTNNLALNGTLSVIAGAVVPPPVITHFGISGTTLTIAGTNGLANGQFVLLSSTNVALPLSQWTPVLTNAFDGSGDFNLTTNLNATVAQQFFILSQ